MESAGEIARIRKDRYVLPETADLITGTLQVHAGGNAHLVSEAGGQRDVFVSAVNLGTAMNGDRVVARLMHEGREQRKDAQREARVIRILERANTSVVGTLKASKNFFYVIPDDPRLQHDIYVRFAAGIQAPQPETDGARAEGPQSRRRHGKKRPRGRDWATRWWCGWTSGNRGMSIPRAR
jgi:exoribonuclease R